MANSLKQKALIAIRDFFYAASASGLFKRCRWENGVPIAEDVSEELGPAAFRVEESSATFEKDRRMGRRVAQFTSSWNFQARLVFKTAVDIEQAIELWNKDVPRVKNDSNNRWMFIYIESITASHQDQNAHSSEFVITFRIENSKT